MHAGAYIKRDIDLDEGAALRAELLLRLSVGRSADRGQVQHVLMQQLPRVVAPFFGEFLEIYAFQAFQSCFEAPLTAPTAIRTWQGAGASPRTLATRRELRLKQLEPSQRFGFALK